MRDFLVLLLRGKVIAKRRVVWVIHMDLNRDIGLRRCWIGGIVRYAIQVIALSELTRHTETPLGVCYSLSRKTHGQRGSHELVLEPDFGILDWFTANCINDPP